MKSGPSKTCPGGPDCRDKLLGLDVRNGDEFERFRSKGRNPLPGVSIPYFEMLELDGKDEILHTAVAYIQRKAKCDTSGFVAQWLLRLGFAGVNFKREQNLG